MIVEAEVFWGRGESALLSLKYDTDLDHPKDLFVEARAIAYEKYNSLFPGVDIDEIIIKSMTSKV